MYKIKKDPLSIAISLVYNLNLLEEEKDYNINELKFITTIENHWITIQKYLTMFNIIQRYCPKIELKGSKLRITKSEIYRRLNDKEKLVLYLYNNQAIDLEHAVNLPIDFNISFISNSIGYLYKKTEDNKLYLTKSGLEIYRYLKKDLSDLIYNNKEIDEIFGTSEELGLFESQTESTQESIFVEYGRGSTIIAYQSEQEILVPTYFSLEDDSSSSKSEISRIEEFESITR